jgi:hypothetical protein
LAAFIWKSVAANWPHEAGSIGYTRMKRDMELIRLLLLQQELGEAPEELSQYSAKDKIYNLQLMQDAGLVDVDFLKNGNGDAVAATIFRLTWAGHDFLDASRDSKVWKLAKEKVLKPGASWTFSLLVEWLKQEAHQRIFGNPPGHT